MFNNQKNFLAFFFQKFEIFSKSTSFKFFKKIAFYTIIFITLFALSFFFANHYPGLEYVAAFGSLILVPIFIPLGIVSFIKFGDENLSDFLKFIKNNNLS